MKSKQPHHPIVPVSLTHEMSQNTAPAPTASSMKLAVKIRRNEQEIRIYNGIDKYILYALCKELKLHDT